MECFEICSLWCGGFFCSIMGEDKGVWESEVEWFFVGIIWEDGCDRCNWNIIRWRNLCFCGWYFVVKGKRYECISFGFYFGCCNSC